MPIFKHACTVVSRSPKAALLAAVLTLCSGAAVAQAPGQMPPGQMPNIAAASGQMHAAAEACNAYSKAQLDQMKQQQKTAAASQGLSAADFDKTFTQSFDATKTQLGALSSADKEKMCTQLKAMAASYPK